MFKTLKQCLSLLDRKQKKKIIFIQVLILTMTLLEIGSIFIVGAFISVLGNFNNFLNLHPAIFYIYNYFNFSNPSEFFIFLSIFVFFIFFISSFFSIFTTYQLAMYGSKIGLDFGTRLYKFYLQKSWVFHSTHNSTQLINKIAQETQRITNGILTHALYMNSKIILVTFMFLAILIYNPFVAIIGFSFFFVVIGFCINF